jgi:hypothetical protein
VLGEADQVPFGLRRFFHVRFRLQQMSLASSVSLFLPQSAAAEWAATCPIIIPLPRFFYMIVQWFSHKAKDHFHY